MVIKKRMLYSVCKGCDFMIDKYCYIHKMCVYKHIHIYTYAYIHELVVEKLRWSPW